VDAGFEPLSVAQVVPMVGDGARVLVERALGPARANAVDRVLGGFQRHYAARPCVHTKLLPGALEALDRGVPNGLVTNKPRAITLLVLDGLGIANRFGTIYAGGDGPLKPAPDGVRRAAESLGVDVATTWLVGDGPQDILAGRAAGAFTVAVRGDGAFGSEERVLAAGPDLVLPSLAQLTWA
jgi:phosphoglycolate phosphatase